jgi:poly(3-hydroxybutyrate) depolymerase
MQFFNTTLFFILISLFPKAILAQTIPTGLSLDSIEVPGVGYYTTDTIYQSFHLYKPNSYDPLTSPLLFAIHGNGGSGAGTINNIINIAEQRKALVVGVNMILGLGFPTVLKANVPIYDDIDSAAGCSYVKPATEIFKMIYKHLLLRESRASIPSYLTGYSAGGQFVSRYMLFRQAYHDLFH